MKRTFGVLLPVILFIAFSYWMYDAVFVRQTQILLRNASATQFDSVDFRIEWTISRDRYPFDSVALGSALHYFGSIGAGELKAIDMELPIGFSRIWVVYRAGERRYGHHSEEYASGIAEMPIEIYLKAENDSVLDVRAKESRL